MEIIMTVLITLLVVALIGAGINLVRLNKKAMEHDMLQLEVVDVTNRLDRMIQDLENDLKKDYCDRIEGWVASTDRRFDKTYNDIRLTVGRLKTLDDTINPNKDFLKNK